MIKLAVLLALTAAAVYPADARFRLERRLPSPRGILENRWAGDSWAFFQRSGFDTGRLRGVLLLEKDPGEKWGDLTAFGLQWRQGGTLGSASAGFLRLRMALGLTADHGGSWSGADPLALVKPPVHRLVLEPATSPGDCDAFPLTGAGADFRFSRVSLHILQGYSAIDRSGTGLHRSATELDRKGSVRETFSYARLGMGAVGISGAFINRTDDSTRRAGRAGLDLSLPGHSALLNAEASLGIEDRIGPAAFLVGMYRDAGPFRHALTAGRYPGGFPGWRSSAPFGLTHNLAGGYGVRWKPRRGVTITSGLEVLDRDRGTTVRAGVQGEETPFPRTGLLQRLTFSSSPGETSFRLVLGATFSPDRHTSLTLRLPAAAHRQNDSTSLGAGAELRLTRSFASGCDATFSVSGSDTRDYRSRVYIYKLSFPGELGSGVLYGKSLMLQAMVSVGLGGDWRARCRVSRFHGYDRESLGSGWEETRGPHRTDMGLQLDWNPK